MAEAISLALAKLQRETDNAKLSPRELLTLMADRLDSGEIAGRPARMVAIIEFETDTGGLTHHDFRCGCTRHEAVALLALAQLETLKDWVV